MSGLMVVTLKPQNILILVKSKEIRRIELWFTLKDMKEG